MESIDTNILVRVLVDEKHPQTIVAKEKLATLKKIFIHDIVLVETIWVLKSCYEFKKKDTVWVLESLIENEAFHFQHKKTLKTAIHLFKNHSADFSDCLILASSLEMRAPLLTFDKKLSAIEGAVLLQS
jgi:predicted nucleic-acid-binding protein